MSRYILNSTTFTKLDDPPGIVENISGYRVEIYYNPTDTTGVILYPYQSMPYTTPIWARREAGEAGTAVVATIPNCCDETKFATKLLKFMSTCQQKCYKQR